MTDAQRARPTNKRSSIFNTFLHNNFGGKRWIMAVWQTGITWAPPLDMMMDDRRGALEHVAKHFAQWVRRLARALVHHKDQQEYKDAKRKSEPGGLTPDELHRRAIREDARWEYRWGGNLMAELNAAKGKGKGSYNGRKTNAKGKGKGKKTPPRQWSQFTYNEQYCVEALKSGRLYKRKRLAEEWTSSFGSYTQAADTWRPHAKNSDSVQCHTIFRDPTLLMYLRTNPQPIYDGTFFCSSHDSMKHEQPGLRPRQRRYFYVSWNATVVMSCESWCCRAQTNAILIDGATLSAPVYKACEQGNVFLYIFDVL